ncbi:MAG: hypothetical protein ACI9ZF_003184, partial [Bradyrhizobium sp.]
ARRGNQHADSGEIQQPGLQRHLVIAFERVLKENISRP